MHIWAPHILRPALVEGIQQRAVAGYCCYLRKYDTVARADNYFAEYRMLFSVSVKKKTLRVNWEIFMKAIFLKQSFILIDDLNSLK
jgi:hypothetical protein